LEKSFCENCKKEKKKNRIYKKKPKSLCYKLICIVCGETFYHSRCKTIKTCSIKCKREYQSQIRKKAIQNGAIAEFGGRCKKI